MKLTNVIAASIAATLSDLTGAVDDWMGCDYRDFCSRHREYLLDEIASPTQDHSYSLDMRSLVFDEEAGRLSATLNRQTHGEMLADELQFNMWLY